MEGRLGDQSVGGEQQVSCLLYVALDSRQTVSWGWRMVMAEWNRWSYCRQRPPVGWPRVCWLVVAPVAGGAAFVLKQRRCVAVAGAPAAVRATLGLSPSPPRRGAWSGHAPPVGRRRSAGAAGPVGLSGSPHRLFFFFFPASLAAVLSPTVRCPALPCVAMRWDAQLGRRGTGSRRRRPGARDRGVTVSPTRCRDCLGARPLRGNGEGAWQVAS